MNRRQALGLMACGSCGLALFGQRRGTQRRGSNQTPGSTAQKDPEGVLLRFPGTLRAVSKKEVLLEVENEQELVFRRTKKTRFLDGDKESAEKAAPIGDHVVIEGNRALNGDLDAVNVIWNEPPPAPK